MLNILTSTVTSNAINQSVFQIVSEGTLKAVGRPAFTLLDKNAAPEAKRYSATKEFLFQGLSMLTYAAIVIPVVKKGGYKVLKKMYGSAEAIQPKVEKLNSKILSAKNGSRKKLRLEQAKKVLESLPEGFSPKNQAAFGEALSNDPLNFALKNARGAQELMTILGSGVVLTIIAPQIVNRILHPIMDFLYKGKHPHLKHKPKEIIQPQPKVDKTA